MTDTSATRHVPPADSAPPADGPSHAPPAPPPAANPLRRTRTGSIWIGIILFAVLLIFTLQNTQSEEISYFGATGHVSLAVAMLLPTAGVLLTAIAGSLRIWQLRRYLHRSARR